MEFSCRSPLNITGNVRATISLTGHELIAFAKTLGYQEYDGLGWYAVIVQKPK
jgi:hypothetical protein